jgi:hypothetical protein
VRTEEHRIAIRGEVQSPTAGPQRGFRDRIEDRKPFWIRDPHWAVHHIIGERGAPGVVARAKVWFHGWISAIPRRASRNECGRTRMPIRRKGRIVATGRKIIVHIAMSVESYIVRRDCDKQISTNSPSM